MPCGCRSGGGLKRAPIGPKRTKKKCVPTTFLKTAVKRTIPSESSTSVKTPISKLYTRWTTNRLNPMSLGQLLLVFLGNVWLVFLTCTTRFKKDNTAPTQGHRVSGRPTYPMNGRSGFPWFLRIVPLLYKYNKDSLNSIPPLSSSFPHPYTHSLWQRLER